MGNTEVVAWIGAVTGVSGILWDIYKWKMAGPRLEVSANPNMEVLGNALFRGQKFIKVRVRNTGTTKTTLTILAVATYASWWKRRRLKAVAQGVVPSTIPGQALPHVLDVGGEWTGLIKQSGLAQEMMGTGRMYCDVYHSWSRRPVQARVEVPALSDSPRGE